MNKPNAEGAIAYALTRLAAELPADMVYHSLAHTRDEVLPAAARLGQLAGLPEPDLDLLRVAAAFHDLGYAETQEEHELCSIRIAAQVLPAFGFASRAIEQVIGMIVATRMPQSPRNLLEQLLADADLDGLGREDALQRSVDLLAERRAYGSAIGDERVVARANRLPQPASLLDDLRRKPARGRQGAQHRGHPGDGGERALTRRLGRTGAFAQSVNLNDLRTRS